MKKNKKLRKLIFWLLGLAAAALLFVVLSNLWMVRAAEKRIVSREEAAELEADAILILGAGVWEGGVPSPMLQDRLEEGLALYQAGAAPKILVSGDHGQSDYDEVNVMKAYLMTAGVPDEDIFMDHAGFSTYESLYRAREVFGARSLIIVTQKYHMYRALYIARRLGLQVLGCHADPRRYYGEAVREAREMLARDKDILWCLVKPEPTYLGEPIDIHGSGSVTND